MSGGFVSLVGAGPGDPQLLTRAAYDRLERAELVLYDALVSQDVLALAPRAQRFYVGKRAGRTSMSQETINRLLVRAARRGRRVVRLKAGDPFVFGRGGEEALALDAAGVPFEVVPGVTAAIAAPALAGIPVTHRGAASAFVTVSGHDERAWAPGTRSAAPALRDHRRHDGPAVPPRHRGSPDCPWLGLHDARGGARRRVDARGADLDGLPGRPCGFRTLGLQ